MSQTELCVTLQEVPSQDQVLSHPISYSNPLHRGRAHWHSDFFLYFVWGFLVYDGTNRIASLAQWVSKQVSVRQLHLRSQDFSIPSVFEWVLIESLRGQSWCSEITCWRATEQPVKIKSLRSPLLWLRQVEGTFSSIENCKFNICWNFTQGKKNTTFWWCYGK